MGRVGCVSYVVGLCRLCGWVAQAMWWPGNYSDYNATLWPYLASWDFPDIKLGWNSKIGPSVAIYYIVFLHSNHPLIHEINFIKCKFIRIHIFKFDWRITFRVHNQYCFWLINKYWVMHKKKKINERLITVFKGS